MFSQFGISTRFNNLFWTLEGLKIWRAQHIVVIKPTLQFDDPSSVSYSHHAEWTWGFLKWPKKGTAQHYLQSCLPRVAQHYLQSCTGQNIKQITLLNVVFLVLYWIVYTLYCSILWNVYWLNLQVSRCLIHYFSDMLLISFGLGIQTVKWLF